jgi:methyl-accepting chemotaxis protein
MRFLSGFGVAIALCAQLLGTSAASAQPVVPPPIAPPKPAVPRAANALLISTGDLNEAVNWARQGDLTDATNSFNLFKQDWNTVVDDVRGESDPIADSVDGAIADVQTMLDRDTAPAQADYYPAFQKLGSVVEDANTQLGQIAPENAALKITTTDLAQSVNWASQGELGHAHDEFGQFQDDWSLVKDAVRQASPGLADGVEAATAKVAAIISNPAIAVPPQSDYYPALQNLLQVVTDTNTQLAAMGPAAAPPQAGPIKISPGNLGESVDWASQGNLARARSEYSQFQDDWKSVAAAVRQRSSDIADSVESAMSKVDTILAASAPDQANYFPALQNLQQAVADANTKLGN